MLVNPELLPESPKEKVCDFSYNGANNPIVFENGSFLHIPHAPQFPKGVFGSKDMTTYYIPKYKPEPVDLDYSS